MVDLAKIEPSCKVVGKLDAIVGQVDLLEPGKFGLFCAFSDAFLDALSQTFLEQVVRCFETHLRPEDSCISTS